MTIQTYKLVREYLMTIDTSKLVREDGDSRLNHEIVRDMMEQAADDGTLLHSLQRHHVMREKVEPWPGGIGAP